MKAKTIRVVLRKKIDEFLDSIEDEDLKKRLSKKIIVTGGCIASMLLQEPVNDFDLYLKDRETCLDLANYYIKRFNPKTRTGIPCEIYIDNKQKDRVAIVVRSAGIASEEGAEQKYEYFECAESSDDAGRYVQAIMDDPGDIQDQYEQTEQQVLEQDEEKGKYRPVFLSTNAITLSNKIQIITRFYGEPEEIHKNYDFVHCTNYWMSWNDEIVLHKDALESLLTRELRYVGSKYPVCSLIRVRKFVKRNWQINAGQILKMVMQINELDLTDIKVLRDQLTGVDAAYFYEIMAKLKEKDPEKVNSAYLCEIIDRMY